MGTDGSSRETTHTAWPVVGILRSIMAYPTSKINDYTETMELEESLHFSPAEQELFVPDNLLLWG